MLFGFNAFAATPFSSEVDAANVILVGQQVSSSVGTVSIKSQPNAIQVTGEDLNATIGTFAVTAGGQVSIDASEEPDMDFVLGTAIVSGSAFVEVTGQPMNVVNGATTINVSKVVSITGQELDSEIGTVAVEAIQNPIVEVTGLFSTLSLGAEIVTAEANVLPLGNIVSSGLGTPVVVATCVVSPEGIPITATLGIVGTTAWQLVDDSATNTWTNVDDSANNTWIDAA